MSLVGTLGARCASVPDTSGHHAAVCSVGGDRTIRPNKLRNCVFRAAKATGLNPELEKGSLLLPTRPEDSAVGRRRPADVFLPTLFAGSPTALDFAVTASQQQGIVELAAKENLASAKDYATKKRTYLNSKTLCNKTGVGFLPMVCETTGAWAPDVLHTLRWLAKVSNRQDADSRTTLD